VDVCWRLQARGWTLGFSAGAMVWHHRRDGVRRFWRQQFHYGAAEADLQRKWPQKYTAGGRVAWAGRLYDAAGAGHAPGNGRRRRIYHGTWGSALFQSVYHESASIWSALGLMPEWYLLIALLAGASMVGIAWAPMRWAIPLLALAVFVPLAQAIAATSRATFFESRGSFARSIGVRTLTAFFHLMQPLARLSGRTVHRASILRERGLPGLAWPWPKTLSVWHETWASGEQRLEDFERRLRERGAVVLRGGDYDRWDLEVRGGMIGAARVRMAIEEHGSGKQMVRFRAWPRWAMRGWVTAGTLLAGAAAVAPAGRTLLGAACVLASLAVAVAVWSLLECGAALAAVREALVDTGGRA
jgi:O-antigen biosynthesis protein